jgi:hypothetical protein
MSIFKTAKPKMPPPLPPPAERSDAETAALAESQRKKFGTTGEGRAATFLTSSGTTPGSAAVRYLGGQV